MAIKTDLQNVAAKGLKIFSKGLKSLAFILVR